MTFTLSDCYYDYLDGLAVKINPNVAFLTMPGYSKDENTLGCKLVTSFLNNQLHGLPSVMASVLLFDGDTGKMKVVMEGNTITGRRTAAASVVATKYLHQGPKETLAILGAGIQAKTHVLALQHTFNFKEVRIWNHHREGAVKLCSELPFPCKVAVTNQDCVRNADVICTTTYAKEPILKAEWVKLGAHINAIGAGIVHHSEIDEELYRKSLIVVDHYESAEKELKGLKEKGLAFWSEIGEIISGVKKAPPADSITIFHSLAFWSEIGEIISGVKKAPPADSITIFHSLGLAIEDVMAANLIYDLYSKDKKKIE